MASHESEIATRPSDSFVGYLAKRAEDESVNRAFEISAQQLDAMFQAETEEQLLAVLKRESVGGRDLVDVEMLVRGYSVHEAIGQYDAPLGHYFMVDAVQLSDGQPILFDCSAPLVMGLLRWYESKEMLPKELVMRGAPTPKGVRLWMEPVPKRVVKEPVKGETVK